MLSEPLKFVVICCAATQGHELEERGTRISVGGMGGSKSERRARASGSKQLSSPGGLGRGWPDHLLSQAGGPLYSSKMSPRLRGLS